MKPMPKRPAAVRLYCDVPLSAGAEFALPDAAAHHALAVLRLQQGDALTLFNGTGGEYAARLVAVSKREARARVLAFDARECESPLAIELALGIASGERMDYSLQKATELGVSTIQPLATERSVVRLNGERAERRQLHWQQVVIAACEQCGRNRVPPVRPVLPYYDFIAQASADTRRLLLSPHATQPLKQAAPADSVLLLIGAEGGLSPAETQAAQYAGFEAVTLGPRVLRAETAPLAALAVLQALWGDL